MCPIKEEYIYESGRNFGDRFKVHLRDLSPICKDGNTLGHCISVVNFSIVGREAHSTASIIKELRFIRVNDPYLNRNLGKFQLLYIWSDILQDTLHSIFSNTLLLPFHNGPLSPLHMERGTQFYAGKYVLLMGVPSPPLTPCLSPLCTYFGVFYCKYSLVSTTYFLIPDKAKFQLAW